jgi:hypothetical protein
MVPLLRVGFPKIAIRGNVSSIVDIKMGFLWIFLR